MSRPNARSQALHSSLLQEFDGFIPDLPDLSDWAHALSPDLGKMGENLAQDLVKDSIRLGREKGIKLGRDVGINFVREKGINPERERGITPQQEKGFTSPKENGVDLGGRENAEQNYRLNEEQLGQFLNGLENTDALQEFFKAYKLDPSQFGTVQKSEHETRRYLPPSRPATLSDRHKDLLIDLIGKGGLNIVDSATGVGDLLSRNQFGTAIEQEVGLTSNDARSALDSLYSNARQHENQQLRNTDDAKDLLDQLHKNPNLTSPIMGKMLESAPQTVIGMYSPTLASIMATGNIQTKARQKGVAWEKSAPYAAGSGAMSLLVDQVAGEITQNRFLNGLVQVLPQSLQTQIFTNLALERPTSENLGKALITNILSALSTGGLVRSGAETDIPRKNGAAEKSRTQNGQTPTMAMPQLRNNPSLPTAENSYPLAYSPEFDDIRTSWNTMGNLRVQGKHADKLVKTIAPDSEVHHLKDGAVIVKIRDSEKVNRAIEGMWANQEEAQPPKLRQLVPAQNSTPPLSKLNQHQLSSALNEAQTSWNTMGNLRVQGKHAHELVKSIAPKAKLHVLDNGDVIVGIRDSEIVSKRLGEIQVKNTH